MGAAGPPIGEKSGMSLNRLLFALREAMFARLGSCAGLVGLTCATWWELTVLKDPRYRTAAVPAVRKISLCMTAGSKPLLRFLQSKDEIPAV